jgi:hypothetical protein
MEGNRALILRIAACVIAIGSALMLVGLAGAAPRVTLVDATARLDYGATGGNAVMVLQVDGLESADVQKPDLVKNVHDLLLPSPPNVSVEVKTEERQPGATARTWLLMMTIKDLPAKSSQKRYLGLDVAGKSTNVEYTLTNQTVSSFSWTVKAPASIAISPGQAIPITISVGPVPATGVTVVSPYLIEGTRNSLLAPNGLRLCRVKTDPCPETTINLAAYEPAQLWLLGAEGIGQYAGSLTVAAREKPEGDSQNITVYSTTPCLQVLGIVVIFCGVFLAWVVNVFGRNLVNRNQMLAPAALLRARLSALETVLATNPTGFETRHTTDKITEVLGSLEPSQLRVPGVWPPAWNAAPSEDQLAAYRKTLQDGANWTAVLEAIVNDGFKPIWSHWTDASKRDAIKTATGNIDALSVATSPPALDTTREKIQAQVNPVTSSRKAEEAAPPPPPKTYQQLNVQIAQVSVIAWIIVILATTAVGALALVLKSSSFGSLADFVTCVLWGLGIPVAGQALSSVGMASVQTPLGVSVTTPTPGH